MNDRWNEDDYLAERRVFWADLTMGLLIIGFAAAGFVVGAWLAMESVLKGVAGGE